MRILSQFPTVNGAGGIGGISPDAAGLFSERSAYDGRSPGFTFFAIDTESLYVRLATSGWSSAIPVRGPQGDIGPQGPQGQAGATGAAGPAGNGILSGATAPSSGLGANGDWYINTATDELYGPKTSGAWGSPISLIGPQGPQGPAGANGGAATIAIGTVTTGNAGTSAAVVNSGSQDNAILDFTIPRGDAGATGPTGPTGPQGPAGATGSAGAAATIAVGTVSTGSPGSGASVANSGTSTSAIFDFTIPRGDVGAQGPQGQQGPQGTAGTVAVGTVTTGNAGTNASVSNSGTSTNAVLDFTIPRGDAGSGSAWTTLEKTANESKTSTTALAADTILQFSMAADTKYLIRMEVWFDTTAAGDFKWRHVGPASPTLVRLRRQWILPNGTAFAGIAVDTAFSAADLALTGTGTNGGFIMLSGIVHNGANAGTFSFNWAQNTSDAGNTIVRAGSYLEYSVV